MDFHTIENQNTVFHRLISYHINQPYLKKQGILYSLGAQQKHKVNYNTVFQLIPI